jgi:tyrosyl-tRNA synthetase
MSKSLGNYIGVTEPPEEIFGKTMRVPDDVMGLYYELLLGRAPDEALPAVEAKRALGRALVTRFHSESDAQAAEDHFDRVHKEHGVPDEIEEVTLGADEVSDGKAHLPAVIAAHFGASRSEARRLLEQGGVRLEGEPLSGEDLDIDVERLDGAVLQVGKRKFRRVRARQ